MSEKYLRNKSGKPIGLVWSKKRDNSEIAIGGVIIVTVLLTAYAVFNYNSEEWRNNYG